VYEVPPGSPDQVRRLDRYRQERPDVDIQPPGADSTVWRAFRDGNLIAYGFTLMVFLDRLEALPEPLGAAPGRGPILGIQWGATGPSLTANSKHSLTGATWQGNAPVANIAE